MGQFNPRFGLSTLVNHAAEGHNPLHAHISPIYQTSTFSFPDVATGAAIWKGEQPGYIYTRMDNPNLEQLAGKIAALEGLDLMRARPDADPASLAAGMVFGSGMAAITSSILACVKAGDTVIAQRALYGATYTFLHDMAPCYGINTVWLTDPAPENWEAAFAANPGTRLAFAETPANPAMTIVDLSAVAEVAHRRGAWLMVDNTFASPYCTRPLALGADVVVHSTTKYLGGHGLVAKKQMSSYGGMVSFELKDGFKAGEDMMNRVRLATLAVSLGNVDSLIQHPASMTHCGVPAEERLCMGITDGLVRFSVGIENIEDILADINQALA